MALKDIFRSKENTESQVLPMKIFDNITEIVRDDLQKTINKPNKCNIDVTESYYLGNLFSLL